MSIEEKKECKAAYLEALSISPVDRDVLKKLHIINDNVLDKWLYVEDRYPSFRACWELWMFLRKRRLTLSRKLNRLIQRSVTRANDASTMLGIPTDDNNAPLAESGWIRSTNTYMFDGQQCRPVDVWEKLGYRSETQLRSALTARKIRPGDDITNFLPTKRMKESKLKSYFYHGKEYTLPELSKSIGLSEQTIKDRISKYKYINGNDISGVNFERFAAGGPPRRGG
jgi:hypothetical protein